ncbi:MAG: UDP-N-acetylmuramoylalanyl-D-glutamate--2,6-diaminopimelate ligase [Gammaproteobacteria bacterium]|nr:UDP-N-acetylmuramoylalanyl-D-glutamate--2,6-diaminopimelate ligase [Gammaproteobacteria bacterium]|tara:strand:+ start:1706 stop:3064 length:1359 start_codon:yes stop_codon:yes gene_type:complete
MINSLAKAAKLMDGVLLGDDLEFNGVSIDTRTINDGELFFAIKGLNFDGHTFIKDANSNGAIAAVVSSNQTDEIIKIRVEDTRLALGKLGAALRKAHDLSVVGITGSNGKTTLKELVAACLKTKAPTLATHGNLNNEIGIPLMLTQINKKHEYAVIEMGANHAGEIAYLSSLVDPDVVVITNAAAAHLEGFGSIDGVAHAKGEILEAKKRPSFAILNADDDYHSYWLSLVEDIKTFSFGLKNNADITAKNIQLYSTFTTFDLNLPTHCVDISLPLAGLHNVQNACAAAAVAFGLNLDVMQIKFALESIEPVVGRLQPLKGINNSIIFDDSYNANPSSTIAAAKFLSSLEGESWFVLGDMKELGKDEKKLHYNVGASILSKGINRLFAFGDLSKESANAFGKGARWYSDINELINDLKTADNETNILVKGSRSMQMELVVDALKYCQSDKGDI